MAELAASGITAEQAYNNGVQTVTGWDACGLLNWRKKCKDNGDALVYPFFGLEGETLHFLQLKFTIPRRGKPKRPGEPGEPIKYESPVEGEPRLYYPRECITSLTDPTCPLIVTEGAKKALAAAANGHAVVGLCGVYGWMAHRDKGANGRATGPKSLHRDFDVLCLRDRIIFIVFDSDISTKKPVNKAANELLSALAAAGAKPRIIVLPAGAAGTKVGIDDYLLSHGRDAIRNLIVPPSTTDATTAEGGPPSPDTGGRVPPAAQVLVGIARAECDLWHDDRHRGYATMGRRSLPIHSTQYRQWLTSRYRKVSGGNVVNSDAMANAIATIEAEAVCDGPTREAYTRVARRDGRIYLHLADAADTVVEVGPGYWRECEEPPVRFRRSPNAKPLPLPTRGGTLDPLRRLLNIESDSQFALIVGWLCGAMRGAGPYPLLVITGDHGSGKSTAVHTLKRLIDPTAGGLRGQPREELDLMVAANNSHVLAFDNFSTLSDWLSDAFCRLATGGGLSKRGLFTDDDEIVFESIKPVILNGITDFVSRPDLLDRAILVHLSTIAEDRRRTEDDYWADFGGSHASVLGALLDCVAHGLASLDDLHLAGMPRMADFARFAVACEADSGQFWSAYTANENNAHDQAIENSPLALAIVDLLAGQGQWEGPPSDLLAILTDRSSQSAKSREWPRTASALSGKLTRLTPSLRKSRKIEISNSREAGGNRNRRIVITRTGDGDRDAAGRRRDGEDSESPSREKHCETSDNASDGKVRDGRDGESDPLPGTPSRRTYGARNGPTSAKGGPVK